MKNVTPILPFILVGLVTACDPSTPTSDTGGGDAGDSLACPTEGAMRIGTCGNCGMQSQTCTGGRWTAASACLGSGPCVPAAVEMRVGMPMCTPQQRLCGADCQWGEWLAAGPAGECEPGDEIACRDGMGGYHVCTTECQYAEVCTP